MTYYSTFRAQKYLSFIFTSICVLIFSSADAQSKEAAAQHNSEVSTIQLNEERARQVLDNRSSLANSLDYFEETESNNSVLTADSVSARTKIRAYIYPYTDVDYFKFTAGANDRVYAATMTSKSSAQDSKLTLLASDGVTVIEFDSNDGSVGSTASSIAGAIIPSNGTYYLKVEYEVPAGSSVLTPYDLYLSVQSGSPSNEMEGNNIQPGELLPSSGWVSGSQSSPSDIDFYSLQLEAGETVFLSLDFDPENDNVTWNGTVGLAPFNNLIMVVNDGNTISPNSEAIFFTAKASGTYSVYIGTGDNATFGTYHLNVSTLPSFNTNFQTYTSTDINVSLPTGPGITTSTLTIADDKRIKKLRVKLNLTHTNMQDLDVELMSPDGNTSLLFNDIGNTTNPNLNLVIDEDAALPIGLYNVVDGLHFQTESAYSLDKFKGMSTLGTWTLTIRDDAANNGGTLLSWGLDIEDDTILTGTTLFSTDFESGDAGFTHSGTPLDVWERGLPTLEPIASAYSGNNCFKTDLNGLYNPSSNLTLFSPDIVIPSLATTENANVSWAMKYAIESSRYDSAFVEVRDVNDPNHKKRIWEWLGNSTFNTVGSPGVNVNEAAGWGIHTAEINEFSNSTIQIVFHLGSDNSLQFSGMAIDDVIVFQNSDLPSVSLSVSSNTGTEVSTSTITATATASAPVTGDQMVTLTVSGAGITTGDYTLDNVAQNSVTLTIPNGMTTATATFKVVDDLLVEGSETASLALSSPTSGMTLGSITTQNIAIADNELCGTGGITFNTQAQIDNFSIDYPGCIVINGDLIINDDDGNGNDISNVNGLKQIKSVNGLMGIYLNPLLTSLDSLKYITQVMGDISIWSNPFLQNLKGLNGITSNTADLSVYNNSGLTSLSGLSKLMSVKNLYIYDNQLLDNLDSLKKLKTVTGVLFIDNNASLNDISGLSRIEGIGSSFIISNSPSLTEIQPLHFLNHIGGNLFISNNNALQNIDGFFPLASVDGDILIHDNGAIVDFCGLYNVMNEELNNGGTAIGGLVYIVDNLTNPTPAQIVSGGQCGDLKNMRTGLRFMSLHDAINDGGTIPGDTIMLLDDVEETFIAYQSVKVKANGFTLTIQDEIPDIQDGKMEIDAGVVFTWLEGNLVVRPAGNIFNYGTLHNMGTIIYNNPSGFSNEGIYMGKGPFQGPLNNLGTVRPGN